LGSVRVTVNASGAVDSWRDYYPYGMTMEQRSGAGSADRRYQFTGHEKDAVTGLTYAGARTYLTEEGIWMQVDPLAEKYPGWSPYNYSLANPLRYIDPDGRQVEETNEEEKKKSWWERIRDFFSKRMVNPDQPPTHIDPRAIGDDLRKLIFGEHDAQKAAEAMISAAQSGTPQPAPDPKRLILSQHARDQMAKQNVSEERVSEAIEKGRQKPGNDPGAMVYELPARDSSSGRGIRVVRNEETGNIITVMDKGTRYK
jgi:RHS repeat-associated protein